MQQKQFTRQQVTRVRSTGALVAVGSVVAAGLLSVGAVAQEVLPTPLKFPGKIEKVVINFGKTKLAAADQQKLKDFETRLKTD